jgi:hypothetical protein
MPLGRVRTGDRERPCARAIAVVDGHVAALGDEADILRLCGAGTEVLGGRESTILPGFVSGKGTCSLFRFRPDLSGVRSCVTQAR